MVLVLMMMMRTWGAEGARPAAQGGRGYAHAGGRRIGAGAIRGRRGADVTPLRDDRHGHGHGYGHRYRDRGTRWRRRPVVALGRGRRRRAAVVVRRGGTVFRRLLVVMGVGRVGGVLVLVVHVEHPAAAGRQLVGMVGGGSCGRSRGGGVRGRGRAVVLRQGVLRVEAQVRGVVHAGAEVLAGQQDVRPRRRRVDGQRRRAVRCGRGNGERGNGVKGHGGRTLSTHLH